MRLIYYIYSNTLKERECQEMKNHFVGMYKPDKAVLYNIPGNCGRREEEQAIPCWGVFSDR